jgi:Asp/Glu/hydantoin racemase
MKKIGVIHTAPATVQSLTELIRREIPGAEVMNLLDDTILNDMNAGSGVKYVRERWITYASILEHMGADAVLSACSTVGEIAEEARRVLTVPVYRIDEAMAEEAVRRGGRIAVLATLPSTLGPTVRLVERKAKESGRPLQISTVLVAGAFEALRAGDRQAHDAKIRGAVRETLGRADLLLLAQASMAPAAEGLPGAENKILTSPESGIRRLGQCLKNP